MEADVTLANNNLLEQLEALGSPQVGSFLRPKLCLCCLTLSLFHSHILVGVYSAKASKKSENVADSLESSFLSTLSLTLGKKVDFYAP